MKDGKPLRLRDFVRVEDFYFSVVGYRNERFIKALLRYVPDASGDRVKDSQRYRKLAHDEAIEYAKRLGMNYYREGLFYVPSDDVREIYKPEERLDEALEYEEVRKVVDFFSTIPRVEMGVTGSRLIGLVGEESDVDFIVYGKWWFVAREKIKQGIKRGEISEPDDYTWEFIYKKRKITLPYQIFVEHERRKYYRAFIGDTYFDLLYVRGYDEIKREIPEEKGIKLGKVEIEAEVLDDLYIFDYPAYYPVKHEEIKAVLSFTHTFVGQVFRGEKLAARGDLEVINGDRYIVVGTRREVKDEYIVSLDFLKKRDLLNDFLKWKS